MAEEIQNIQEQSTQLEGSTYEIIQNRLQKQGEELRTRLNKLNETRKKVFGAVDTKLIATDRITTDNNCIPRDMVAISNHFIFGYNVHIGLRSEIKLSDVFSVYRFEISDHSFHQEKLDLLNHKQFDEDFYNLYKYYKNTVFVKFAVIGPNLFMVFQIGKGVKDIKTFKWVIKEDNLQYLGNRFDHEVKFPDQHDFSWQRTTRDMHRRGKHPHVSIQDRVFVETVGGDLTIKIEDNTDSGHGVYTELVEHKDQTLDDAEISFADLGNLIVLKIRPYQEKIIRYIIFNEKMQEALRVDSLEKACVLLPDDQGLIFSNGYYLQTGEYKIFDHAIQDLHFEKRISSPNGEDFLYIFYNQESGDYVLLNYNLVEQKVETPIICNGFSIFSNGELCYFKAEDVAGRHHVVQVWQTPYSVTEQRPTEFAGTYLFKVGNKDIVRGMAECNEMLTLLNKGDTYANLYIDLVKKSHDIIDSYYWISHQETFQLNEPLKALAKTASSAIDEFEKVRRIKQNTLDATKDTAGKVKKLLDKIRRHKAKSIDEFVSYLSDLRILRGEVISLKELRYVDMGLIEGFEEKLATQSDKISKDCVEFLLDEQALQPYQEKVKTQEAAIGEVTKVLEADLVGEAIDNIAKELELLIDVVSNLKIEDATQTTRIIDNISAIYSQLNQLRAQLKRRRKELMSTEASAEFNAQLKLLSQGVINYLDLCDTPERCEEYLTKLMVQLEELEGKFTEFDEFILTLSEKREEIYNAFETRKLGLVEARNKRASSLMSAAERILKGIKNRVSGFEEVNQINAYFASDLMIEKVRDIVEELTKLNDSVKAGDVQAQLKTLREDAVRQLKDRNELFVGGENVIKFGRHNFSVNVQALDLTIVPRDGDMYFHLTGTNFFDKIIDPEFEATRDVWTQSLVSENRKVYRGEYLAYQMFKQEGLPHGASVEELTQIVQTFMSTRYHEGYVKGVHDGDAAKILQKLIDLKDHIDLLRYEPEARACASLYWHGLIGQDEKTILNSRLKGAGVILQLFPHTKEFGDLIANIQEHILMFAEHSHLYDPEIAQKAGEYLFYELTQGDNFIISHEASEVYKAFNAYLKKKKFKKKFDDSVKELSAQVEDRFDLIRNWLSAFVEQEGENEWKRYIDEATALLFAGNYDVKKVVQASLKVELTDMVGDHATIQEGKYALHYNDFMKKLAHYERNVVPKFESFVLLKKELTQRYRQELRLEEFRPRVLSSFVRNQLIDKVYLPIIGDNLAKQIGTVGENTRTDRMGMLLLISPPGYGKTTLMEYIANRLGLIFMKINGPAIGHHVTSLDPSEAPNAAAREELAKLNLSLEMGDNVMLYLDDIQHCNPEFLQKFISLCDAQRKIEGVYKGKTRTYDLRGKKVAVVMAGNPYTESGEKFQIPDMLANRADTYNLGDIIGDSANVFKMSYIENALTSNEILNRLATKPQKDIYTLIRVAETGSQEGMELESNISGEELNEYISVLQKLFKIRDVVLTVNQAYIQSAAQADEYRTEPRFQLQGSYRNMNKLAERIAAIMNEEELTTLILSHYENESQTLTSGAEANLLKFKALCGFEQPADKGRWKDILEIFQRNKLISADRLGQMVQQMGAFSEGLMGIREALEKGMRNGET